MAEPTEPDDPTEAEKQAATSIDASDLNTEFIRVSSDLAYWNRVYAVTLKRERLAEAERERIEAELRLAFRADAEAQSQKVTEGTLEAMVIASKGYQLALAAEIDCEHEKVLASGTVDAICTKRDMLVSLGAHIRAEMQRDPSIREPEKR